MEEVMEYELKEIQIDQNICDNRFNDFVQAFIETDKELALFQLAGHSYDLDIEDKWNIIEDVFKIISEQDDILPMTTI